MAQSEAFVETILAIGTVAAQSGRVASLSAPLASRIATVHVTVGQRVPRGMALIRLDPAPFATSARAADAALTVARKNHDRAVRLSAAGIIPRKELEQATSDLAQARALATAEQRSAALSVLRAPIAGVVTKLAASLGASVDPTQPLVEIVDPSALDVVFNVTPAEAGRIRTGTAVRLKAGQSGPGEPLGVGTVADIGASVDSISRGVLVRVRVPAARRVLRIGETVYGEISGSAQTSGVSVPVEALVPDGNGFRVFVVGRDGIARSRPVEVLNRSSTVARVSAGVAAGERVVAHGAYGLEDGVRVSQSGN